MRICEDSVRIRTDATLDQDCVLKANVHICTACMIVSLLTTCLNFKTPPVAQVAPFRCKIRESNAEVPLDTKTQQARLPADSGLYNSTFPSLVNCIFELSRASKRSARLVCKHSMVPKSVCSLFVILARHWSLESSAPILHLASVRSQYFLLLVALALFIALFIAIMIRSS